MRANIAQILELTPIKSLVKGLHMKPIAFNYANYEVIEYFCRIGRNLNAERKK